MSAHVGSGAGALLGRWSTCQRCRGKAFGARDRKGVAVWVCIDPACATQRPLGAADALTPAGTGVRFVHTPIGDSQGVKPSSWALVEQGPSRP